MSQKVFCVEFEIPGNVKNTVFTKIAEVQAKMIGVRGWLENTANGTIKGHIEGNEELVKAMKEWIEKVGVAKAQIEKAVFKELKEIKAFTCENFSIK